MKSGHTDEYWKGVEAGKKHLDSSPATLKRFDEIGKQITTVFEAHSKVQADNLRTHQEEDMVHFKAMDEKMDTLATKDDIKEMKDAFEDFTKAVGFLKTGGKWGYRTLLVLATIVVSIVAIGGGFRTMFQWLTGTTPL